MNLDRFKNYEQEVRDLVLAFEKQGRSNATYFDVDQLEVIADYYLEVYDIEGLESAVKLGEQLFPGNSEIRLRHAHLFSIRGQYNEAMELLQSLEQAEPENTDVCYALGALYSLIDRPPKAIDYYLKAAKDGYQLDMVYGNIADEYYYLGKTTEAIAYYRKSIQQNPDENRSLYNLACTWDELGRNEESVEFFSQVVAQHPFAKGAWYCLGCVYCWLSLYKKAADAYEYAIAIDKTYLEAYAGLSECYSRSNNFARAVQALRDMFEYAQDPQGRAHALYQIGGLYFQQDNYHTASAYFHDALKEDPSDSTVWADLGRCSERLGYPEEAAGYYRRAIDLDPDTDEHWLSLADLYISMQRYPEACALLESSRADANNRFSFDSRLLYCYYKMGRRNCLFSLLQEDSADHGSAYRGLFIVYPEFTQDPEIVNVINSISQ